MKLAFTGHRPDKLGGYKSCPTHVRLQSLIALAIQETRATQVISGMALGVDQWAAREAVKLGVPFVAAIPFVGQEKVWPEQSQAEYKTLLDLASEIVVVSPGEYSRKKMQVRNEWMVDRCDVLVAVFDGSKGGTANCVKYAEQVKKPVLRITP